MTDAVGSSEGGANGVAFVQKGSTAMKGGGPTVRAGVDSTVLDENLEPVVPGSGVDRQARARRQHPGRLLQGPGEVGRDVRHRQATASAGRSPATSRRSRRTARSRCSGRGSVSINSGGEKIFPEEVEAAIKSHPDCFDAVVVGVPDERWGSRVVAVVEPRADRAPDARRGAGALPQQDRGLQGPARAAPGREGRALAVGQARLPLGEGSRARPGLSACSCSLSCAGDPARAAAVPAQVPDHPGARPRTQDGVGDLDKVGGLGAGVSDSCSGCHGRPRGSAGFGGDVVTRPDSRDAPHLFGLGLKEQLADEITADLRAIRAKALADAQRSGRSVEARAHQQGHLVRLDPRQRERHASTRAACRASTRTSACARSSRTAARSRSASSSSARS